MKPKNAAAVKLGRLGGKARAKKLNAEERSEIARKAGKASLASPKHPNNAKEISKVRSNKG